MLFCSLDGLDEKGIALLLAKCAGENSAVWCRNRILAPTVL